MDVRRDGAPLPPLRTRKGLWLLALLALRAERQVERTWLAGTLWPESTESDAYANLRRSLYDLRRALGPQAYRLHSVDPHTLSLDLTGACVDVVAFDRAVERGDPASLEQAVGLYRGPLLEGCLEEWALPERQAREQAVLRAREQLAEHVLSKGETAATIAHLRAVMGIDPLRQSALRRLMDALAAEGDYAGAVLAYREFRLRLHRELHTEPDAETTTLFEQLRARARGQGTAPVRAPASPPNVPPLRRLPHPMSGLVGRAQEIEEVTACLGSARLLTLTGAGGVGKTRLAIAVAQAASEAYPNGVCFVDLAPLSDPGLVAPSVASALEVREEPGRPLIETLRDFLRSKALLLILDNCEHLLDACAALVAQLLEGCPHQRILATSRQSLGITGELAWRVPSLPVPPPQALPTSQREPETLLGEYASVQLFVERAQSVSPPFRLIRDNSRAVAQICRRLDGIPLALELAAARVKALSVEQIAARLDDRFRLLTGGSRTALPRQQTLRALIDWSYDLLTPEEQVLLRRLSVFAGGWTLEAAEAVCSADALDLLTSLVDKSLAVYEEQAGEARYRLLETVREYARDRLLESGEMEEVRERHFAFFLRMAEEIEPKLTGLEQAAWLDRLEGEHDNLRAASGWALSAAEGAQAGLRLAGALWRFWEIRGHIDEGRGRLKNALDRPDAREPTQARAKALCGIVILAQQQSKGGLTFERGWLDESLQIYRALGDKRGISMALGTLAVMTGYQGDRATAIPLQEESLRYAREVGDKHEIAFGLLSLGNMVREEGDYEYERACYEESLPLFEEIGNRWGIGWSLWNLGSVTGRLGDYAGARASFEKSLAIFQELGSRWGIALNLESLGKFALDQSDWKAARAYYEECLEVAQEMRDRYFYTGILLQLGYTAIQQGDYEGAHVFLAQSLALRRDLGDRPDLGAALDFFAILATVQGQRERAARIWGAADTLRAGPHPMQVREVYRYETILQSEYDRLLSEARAALGEEAFNRAWAEGQAMTLEQVIAYCTGTAEPSV